MEIVKIPRMSKMEYDQLINEGYVSRIAFKGGKYPYVAPFLYLFDGKFMYFLSTRYGKKIRYFRRDPHVSVEIEEYSRDFSSYKFVVLSGRLVGVEEANEKKTILEKFVSLIKDKNLSKNIMVALGHSPEEAIETIKMSERILIWKLVGVKEIIGLKSGREQSN
jgi:nitroimidazol reductase NimA-like FMN-containing flavoprotein (pyridoxamine 5'-phosphate oxidase superfamily)